MAKNPPKISAFRLLILLTFFRAISAWPKTLILGLRFSRPPLPAGQDDPTSKREIVRVLPASDYGTPAGERMAADWRVTGRPS